jgi:hypothetical protein
MSNDQDPKGDGIHREALAQALHAAWSPIQPAGEISTTTPSGKAWLHVADAASRHFEQREEALLVKLERIENVLLGASLAGHVHRDVLGKVQEILAT